MKLKVIKTQQIEEFDAILHYIKMASTLKVTNINNNAGSNPGSEDKDIPTQAPSQGPSQVNYPSTSKNVCHIGKNNPYNTQLALHSSDNLSHKVSFKSFESIQQSHKRSRTNSCNETSDIVSDSELNNLMSNSNELLDQFNTKTKEIIKGLHELHFSTIDLRNKLNSGRVNNDHPIITQVIGRNNISTSTTTTSNQVRVDIYPPGQSCWWEIRGFLHKEMNLCIKATYCQALNNNEIYPPGQSCSSHPLI